MPIWADVSRNLCRFVADPAASPRTCRKTTRRFWARSQVFASKEAFSAKVGNPAWRTKQSWSIIATEDRSINPELEREMAKRAGSVVTEIKASHAVFASHAEKVADVIETAARHVGLKSK